MNSTYIYARFLLKLTNCCALKNRVSAVSPLISLLACGSSVSPWSLRYERSPFPGLPSTASSFLSYSSTVHLNVKSSGALQSYFSHIFIQNAVSFWLTQWNYRFSSDMQHLTVQSRWPVYPHTAPSTQSDPAKRVRQVQFLLPFSGFSGIEPETHPLQPRKCRKSFLPAEQVFRTS